MLTPEEQDQATHNAAKYRDAEQRINDQIRSISNMTPTDANKKELRRLTRLAEQKRTRAQHWDDRARSEVES